MRICPVCSATLKEYDYFFCSNCLNDLPQGLAKLPKPHILNVKLKYELIPYERFLFFNIPYEHRFSAKVIKTLIWVVVLISIVLLLKYNFSYGYEFLNNFR